MIQNPAIQGGDSGILTTISVCKGGDGTTSVYDYAKKAWVELSNTYITVTTSNFFIKHNGRDMYDAAAVFVSGVPIPYNNYTGPYGVLMFDSDKYPNGLYGLEDAKVMISYSSV